MERRTARQWRVGRSHQRALGPTDATGRRHRRSHWNARDGLGVATALLANRHGSRCGSVELPGRWTHARSGARLPRVATAATGAMGMPRVVYSVVDKTDR